MHTLIHRALSPQTISYAWLVLTVALTFALAVAQSAIAAGPSLSAAGLPAVHVALAGSAPAADAPRCRAAAPTVAERGAAPPSAHACRVLDRSAGTALAGAPIIGPATPHRGADALVALYGGAGPHGPPVPPDSKTNFPAVARLFAADLDLDLSLSHRRSGASGPFAPGAEAFSSLVPVIRTPA